MNKESIEYVLRKIGAESFKDNGEWLTTSCPLAPWQHASGSDHRPSFGAKEGEGVSGVHCFSCGFSGGLLSLVRKYGQYAVPEGKITEAEIQELTDYIILAEENDRIDNPIKVVRDVVLPRSIDALLGKADKYFIDRGLTAQTVNKWQLGYAESYFDHPTNISFRRRALFPLYEEDNGVLELRGVIGRTTVDEEPKYLNMPANFRKSDYVYGGWLIGERDKIIVVEGPFDCLAVNQLLEGRGLSEEYFAVALMGADPSKAQIEWLKDHASEVIIMLDNDSAGRLGKRKLETELEKNIPVSVISWADGVKDPDEAGETVIEMLESRRSLLVDRLAKLLG